ncbi:hypothetical protein KMZ30_07365 [Phycicoccus sp. KQZ13P-1]|uniref:hypothetical protein n=1 Tax=Phycicoccus mangrovi TaxID=2840470 RepID=UPI001C00723E|nr:hypothetical protein [Phycicoccus mangrovi]MBT9255390.1 hypothetical protein [Phycicoccus mangrovi]
MTIADLSTLTVGQWREAITLALRDHNVTAVAHLLGAMAVYHPDEAEAIRQELLLDAAIANARDEARS